MAALAALIDGQGRCQQAETLYRRAIAVFERTLGPEHYELSFSLNNTAAIRHARGAYAEAEQLYRQALACSTAPFRAHLTANHDAYNNLAVCHMAQGREFEARALLARAGAPCSPRQPSEPTHPHLVVCRENYAALRRTP